MLRIYLLLFLTFCCITVALAETFIVTSNADAGPGTLREALTKAAANGSAEKDFINFNLPDVSEAGRTITLQSELPIINSDVLIDCSTQPGTPLSINGAKVVITSNSAVVINTVFYVKGVNYFELDGVVIKNITVTNEMFYPYRGTAITVGGINKEIVIGQPGKGNVFYNLLTTIYCTTQYTHNDQSETLALTLKNNIIGIHEDGIQIASNYQSALNMYYVYNLTIGGEGVNERNIIYTRVLFEPNGPQEYVKYPVTANIKNNIFGANALQMRPNDQGVINSYDQNSLTLL